MVGDEDDSDLDQAWKMLDIARAIVEKSPDDTLEKAKIFSALAEVSMEREDIDNSLGDYFKALAILEKLFEPDHRRIIDLYPSCLVNIILPNYLPATCILLPYSKYKTTFATQCCSACNLHPSRLKELGS
jgi:hypothetical protein